MEITIWGALVSALGFGIANIVIKKALGNTSSSQILLTAVFAGSCLLFAMNLTKGFPQTIPLELIFTFILFAFFEVGLSLSLYKAFEVADVTVASGVISSYPIISTLIAILFLNEVIHTNKLIFIFLLVIGAILISIDWKSLKTKRFGLKSFTKGLPWAVLCLLINAIYLPLVGNFTASGNWEFLLFGIKTTTFIFLFILFVVIKRVKIEMHPRKLLVASLIGVLSTIGWIGLSFASNNSVGMIGVIVAIGSAWPLVTAIGGRFFLKERLHSMQYAGIIIVVTALILTAIA